MLLTLLTGYGADSDQEMLTEGARAARSAASEVNTVRLTSRQLLDGKLWTPTARRMVMDSEESLEQVVAGFDARQPGSDESRRTYDRFGDALDAIALSILVLLTTVDPVKVTEYSVVFAAMALPLTYLPILIIANDPDYMGRHTNRRLTNVLGLFYLGLLLVASIAAIPLMIVTRAGQ